MNPTDYARRTASQPGNSPAVPTPHFATESPRNGNDSGPSAAESGPAAGQPALSTAQSAPSTAESGPATAQSAPSTVQSAPSTAQSAPSTAESGPATVQSAPSAAESGPSAAESGPAAAQSGPPTAESGPPDRSRSLDTAIRSARQRLFQLQQADGHWCGELEGDSILQSEYILLMAWLDRLDQPSVHAAARTLLLQQQPHGGWSQFPGGDVDISASVKAYFALKLTGQDPDSEPMRRAAGTIRQHGGADAVNSFTRFYLALLGQISYDHCPAVPPEAVLLPRWFPLNMYRVSAWSRTIFVPLSIMWAHRPANPIPAQLGIPELFLRRPEQWPPLQCPGRDRTNWARGWERFFRSVDTLLKQLEAWRVRPLRARALRAAERWMLERFQDSDGLGAIFPPIIWSLVALKCLGYDDQRPEVQYCLDQLDQLMIHERDTTRLQPCKSPVWDTALSLRALAAASPEEPPVPDEHLAPGERLAPDEQTAPNDPQAAGIRQATGFPRHSSPVQDANPADDQRAPRDVTAEQHDAARLDRAVRWLLDREVRQPGDWSVNVSAEPGGWFFEYRNAYYPDVDDTIMVLMALREAGLRERKSRTSQPDSHLQRPSPPAPPGPRPADLMAACERARRWVLAMQNRDGGWGAFDRDNDCELLCHVPFADHNAMIDPSTPDIAGRVLEALGIWGMSRGTPAVDRALEYLRRTQEEDGSWLGRWGVNYIYGTWQVLAGLVAVGVPPDDPRVVRGAQWLLRHQLPSGGWGESAATYAEPALRGQGPETPSQTAWAVLGLLAAGYGDHDSVRRGVQWLLRAQRPDGSWQEEEFTGTGFPLVFYLRYHMYPLYFPLLALSRYARHASRQQPAGDQSPQSSCLPVH